MKRTALAIASCVSVLVGAGTLASAQNARLALDQSPAVASSGPLPAQRTPNTQPPAGEPRELSGILQNQNEVRAKLGLPLLTWSPELAASAKSALGDGGNSACNISVLERTGDKLGLATYYAGAIRVVGSAPQVQDIEPAFIVSEWAGGQEGLDSSGTSCDRRKMGYSECLAWQRMTRPESRVVGCAREVCGNGAQLWACGYAAAAPVATPVPAKKPAVKGKPKR